MAKPGSESGEGSIAHYNAILIEDLKSEFRAVIEHVEGVRESLERKMADGFREVHGRLDVHELYLKENEKRWEANEKRWEENDSWQRECVRLLSSIDEKVESHESRIVALEADRISQFGV